MMILIGTLGEKSVTVKYSLPSTDHVILRDVKRGRLAEFDKTKIVRALYRPFSKRWLFFDRVLNEEIYQWPKVGGPAICVTDIGSGKAFMVLLCDSIADLHVVGAGASCQCFPLSHLNDTAVEQFRKHYADDTSRRSSTLSPQPEKNWHGCTSTTNHSLPGRSRKSKPNSSPTPSASRK